MAATSDRNNEHIHPKRAKARGEKSSQDVLDVRLGSRRKGQLQVVGSLRRMSTPRMKKRQRSSSKPKLNFQNPQYEG